MFYIINVCEKVLLKNKVNKPFMKVRVFSFKVAVVTFSYNKTRRE